MEQNKDHIGAAVRGEAVAELPARRFVHVTGFLDTDYVEFKAGEKFGGGVFGGIEWENKSYTRDYADECVRNGVWREVGVSVSARAADAPSEPSELRWREKCAALIDIWDDAQANPPESRCYVEDAWPTMINEVRAELAAAAKSRAADALDSQPTVSAVLAELRADLRELANNTEAFGEYSQEAARVAFDSATDALDEVAAKYATSQPTDPTINYVRSEWESMCRKAVAVLNRHIVPDGISDHEALNELYGIFDSEEHRATGAIEQDACEARQAVQMGIDRTVAAMAASKEPHWLDGEQSALGGKTAREGYAANPEYADLYASSQPTKPDGWISIGDRLPDLHSTVALLDENRWMNTGSSDHNVNWHGAGYLCEFGQKYWSVFGESRSQCLDAVTHWMPIPLAPASSQPTDGGVRNG